MYLKRGLALLGTICIGVLALAIGGAQVVTAVPAPPAISDFINIYTPDPLDGSTPRQMIQDGDTFWFTDPGRNAIGKLVVTDTADFDFTFYPIDTANSQPSDLAKDGDTIWFTQLAANKIGKLDTTTDTITDYNVPTPNSEPTGIDVANDGTVWFVQRAGNNLAKFDPTTEQFEEYEFDGIVCPPPDQDPTCDPSLIEDSEMEDVVVVDSNGFVWFTAPGVNKIGGFDIINTTFRRESTITAQPPQIVYTPSQIAKDNKNNLWVSTEEGTLGIYSPSTVQIFQWFAVGSPSGKIDGLFWRANGINSEFWFTESNTGFVSYMLYNSFDGVISLMRFTPGGTGGDIYGVSAEADGTAWIASSGTGAIIEWVPPYFRNTYLPLVSK